MSGVRHCASVGFICNLCGVSSQDIVSNQVKLKRLRICHNSDNFIWNIHLFHILVIHTYYAGEHSKKHLANKELKIGPQGQELIWHFGT